MGNGSKTTERSCASPAGGQSLWDRLSRSRFRSQWNLSVKMREYVLQKGLKTVALEAEKFVRERLAPACPKNDGRQTPMRRDTHPVFMAQHGTASCCRACLAKWHG